LSRLKPIYLDSSVSDPVIETIERVFPCSGILYLCFESLGLDITSVILNPFKTAATYPFFDFFLSKNHTNSWFPRDSDTLCIERFLSIPTNPILFWIGNLLKLDPFNFYIEDILTKLFQFIDWH